MDAVRRKAAPMPSQTMFATHRRRRVRFPAPKDCAAGMQKPAQIPSTKPMTRNVTDPVAPTAASAPVPTSYPTTAASAML